MEKKIAIVTDNLIVGGIATYTIELMEYLDKKGYLITLFYSKCTDEIKKQIPSSVIQKQYSKPNGYEKLKIMYKGHILSDWILNKIARDKKKKPIKFIQKQSLIYAQNCKKNEEKYDFAFAMEEFFSTYYVVFNIKAIHKIGWIHPDYKSLNPDKTIDLSIFEKLENIVTVSEVNRKNLMEMLPEVKNKVITIECILNKEKIRKMSAQKVEQGSPDSIHIVTVCRIDNSSKRIDRIIKAAEYFKEKSLDFEWNIIGDGPDFNSMQSLANQCKVNDVVKFLGKKENPYPYIKAADVFVLTSQYEGKPIVIEEAKILGCPVVVTNYSGATQQVDSRIGAVIENNSSNIGENLFKYMSDREQIEIWKLNLKKDDFSNLNAIDQLKNVLLKE